MTVVWNIFVSKKNSFIRHKYTYVSMSSTCYSCQILMEHEFFLADFRKNAQIQNFMWIRPVGDELFLVYGWTGKCDKANCHFLQFCDVPKNGVKASRDTQPRKITQCHSLAAMNCDVKVTYVGGGSQLLLQHLWYTIKKLCSHVVWSGKVCWCVVFFDYRVETLKGSWVSSFPSWIFLKIK
jgi:hypothetical protein